MASFEFDVVFTDSELGPVGILGEMADLGTVRFGPAEWWITTIGHATNPALTWYLPESHMDAFVTRNHEVLQTAVNRAADSWADYFNCM